MEKRICIFGSSVNPPTKAHVAILHHFVQLKKFDEVWLLPVYKHMYASKSNLVSFDHRLEMCNLATERLKGVSVEQTEMVLYKKLNNKVTDDTKRFKVGTVDILTYLTNEYPNTKFHFVMGADAFVDLCQGKWKNGDKIPEMAHLEVVQRDAKPTENELRQMAFGKSASFHRVSTISEKVSSTRARELTDMSKLKQIVPNSVAEYMQCNHLYGFGSKI